MKSFIVTLAIVSVFAITITGCNQAEPSQTKEQTDETKETEISDDMLTITSVNENIDPYDLKDGTYPVSIDFSEMINHNGSVVLDFKDSYASPGDTKTIKGSKLYDYFYSLSDDEKSLFTQNCTYLTVKDGVITEFYRVYVP